MEIERDRTAEGIEHVRKSLNAEPENPLALGILAYHAITAAYEMNARQWLLRVKHQPRVPPAQAEQLLNAFRQAFGRGPE